MITLKYQLKKIEDNGEEIEIVEITAETDQPSTRIVFEKSSKLLAETFTDAECVAICCFTPSNRKVVVKASVGEESEQITVPKLTDLNEEED